MLYTPSTRGFCLTPAYDVVPNLWQREHILSIAGKTGDINREDLVDEGKHFALSSQHTQKLMNEAAQGVAKALTENKNMLHHLAQAYPLCCRLLEDIRENLATLNNLQNTGSP